MFSSDSLNRYLVAVHIKKGISAESVLPLYKYGFILREQNFKDIKIHDGYYNTIQRYIDDNKVLTKEELSCILRLYDITNITVEEAPEVVQIVIKFIPGTIVQLSEQDIDVSVKINYVPDPVITLDIPLTLDFAPQTIVEMLNLINITFAPETIVSVDVLGITYVPEPIVELDETTIPPVYPTVNYASEPIVSIFETAIQSIAFVPQTIVELFFEQPPASGNYFWGYTGYNSRFSRTKELSNIVGNPDTLDTMLNTPNPETIGKVRKGEFENNSDSLLCTNWTSEIPFGNNAFVFFMIPTSIAPRTSYSFGSGFSSIPGTVFPEAESTPIVFGGVSYNIYFSNIRTLFMSNVTLNA